MSACQTKHPQHKTSPVKVFLRNYKGKRKRFVMDIYDWQEYSKFKGNCLAKDRTSQAIQTYGGYEPTVSALVQQLLDIGNKRNLVIDFGAHIGWYTLLAALYGYDVACIEGDMENLQLLIKNATYNKVQKKLIPNFSYIDENSPQIELEGKKLVNLLKVDMRGSEIDAAAMSMKMLEARKVRFALFKLGLNKEAAKSFIKNITDCGYKVYCVPPAEEAKTNYAKNPLEVIKKSYSLDKVGYTMHQSYLFIRSAKQ